MGGREKHRRRNVAPQKAQPPETPAPATPNKPAPPMPPRFVIANTFLAGTAFTLAGIGTRHFWPSLTTLGVMVGAAAILGGGYGLLKSLYGDELKAYYRQVMARHSTTGIVVAVLAIEAAAGLVMTEARKARVVRIVPGARLYAELGFPNQKLDVVMDGARFTFTEPQQTLFYICGGKDHLNGALEKESKGRADALATIAETTYGLVVPEDKAVRDAIVEKWKNESPLRKKWPFADRSGAPTATFFAPAKMTLTVHRISSEYGVESYEAELP